MREVYRIEDTTPEFSSYTCLQTSVFKSLMNGWELSVRNDGMWATFIRGVRSSDLSENAEAVQEALGAAAAPELSAKGFAAHFLPADLLRAA